MTIEGNRNVVLFDLYIDLSDLYVDLSDLDLSDLYVDLSDLYVVGLVSLFICLKCYLKNIFLSNKWHTDFQQDYLSSRQNI